MLIRREAAFIESVAASEWWNSQFAGIRGTIFPEADHVELWPSGNSVV